jgi:hypothetical protein
VAFCDELGEPLVETKLALDGGATMGVNDGLATQGGMLRVGGFRRGDATADGSIDIGDAIAILDLLFVGLSLPCHDAVDVNDDAQLDIADPIYLLTYLFVSGAEPPAPGPDACGLDTTPDTLYCLEYGVCD